VTTDLPSRRFQNRTVLEGAGTVPGLDELATAFRTPFLEELQLVQNSRHSFIGIRSRVGSRDVCPYQRETMMDPLTRATDDMFYAAFPERRGRGPLNPANPSHMGYLRAWRTFNRIARERAARPAATALVRSRPRRPEVGGPFPTRDELERAVGRVSDDVLDVLLIPVRFLDGVVDAFKKLAAFPKFAVVSYGLYSLVKHEDERNRIRSALRPDNDRGL
jgi:hypothetical protein